MGIHAFPDDPDHCLAYQRLGDGEKAVLFGLSERWNLLAARHRSVLDAEADFPGVDHFIMTLHIGGSRVRRIDRQEFDREADRGAVSLQVPGSGGSFRSTGSVDYGHFYFRQSLVDEVAEELNLKAPVEMSDFFGRMDLLCAKDMDDYLRRAADCEDPPSSLEMDSRSYLIVVKLLRQIRGLREETRAGDKVLSSSHVARVLDLIETRLGEPLRLSELASAIGLSPFHFARLFRANVGEAPAAFVMRRRTQRARDLILQTDLPLIEIAHRTGFCSQSHMTRRVRRMFGETPGQLRRR